MKEKKLKINTKKNKKKLFIPFLAIYYWNFRKVQKSPKSCFS